MNDDPLVSIITPVLNGNKYLEQCIHSVLNQTYHNIEHIFVDGGSTDASLETLAAYQSKYPERIRFITGKDKGVGDAVRKGYAISRGEIIGWIDSDDIYEIDAIETAVKFFGKNTDASFVYGGCNMINEISEATSCFIIKDFNFVEWINIWHYIVFCAAFYKRSVIEKAGYLNDLGNDLDFYLRVSRHFKMHRIDKRLTNWRLHDGSISMKRESREHKIREDRAKEDFCLILKYRGNLLSPRALVYYMVLATSMAKILSPYAETLRPFLGFIYPLFKKGIYLTRWLIRDFINTYWEYVLRKKVFRFVR